MAAEIDQNALQLLVDRSELQDLVVCYAHYSDRRDFDNLRTLYHPDAIEDHGAFKGNVDAFIAWCVKECQQFEITMHSISSTRFVVDGDKAQGIAYVEAFHRTKAPNRKHVVIWGRYLDQYERRNGAWKFSYRTHAIDRCEIHDVEPAWYDEKTFHGMALGTSGADDPSHRVMTMFKKR